ncbi:thioredoxin family protein [Ramlibacter rhizophilus]|uniref:Thioredoxin n=1 Tax=Ramlibacter rhizophilus TaxID=1781167 RepID=A0A4Z0BCB2_9BURK|nr:thioredoxin family protein [Ramlibacter rhizophilus]TFY96281.1 thioredoxin [Ramlibacter rhizophilus]
MNDTPSLPPAPADDAWQVICLCADWCGTCREWRAPLEALARAHPQVRFAWVDIEDQADAVADYDVETFPTLLIAKGATPRFLGPVLPHAGNIERLLASLRENGAATAVSEEARALLQRLQSAQLEPI